MKCLGKYNKWCQIRPDCSPFKQSARNSRGLFLPEPLPETWNRPGDDVRLDARLHWLTQLIRYSEGRVRSAFLAGVGDWLGGRGLCQPAGNDPTGEAVGTAATAHDGCVDSVASVVLRRRTCPAAGILPWLPARGV